MRERIGKIGRGIVDRWVDSDRKSMMAVTLVSLTVFSLLVRYVEVKNNFLVWSRFWAGLKGGVDDIGRFVDGVRGLVGRGGGDGVLDLNDEE